MDNVKVNTLYDGVPASSKEVVMDLPKEECDLLRNALGIVGKYRKLALQCVGHKDKDADWTMVNFAVKNDKVIITVEYGMCG